MSAEQKRQVRILGRILYFVYIIFVFYFLLISEIYGRSGEMRDYHYNLVLFKEIKRFWTYRKQLGIFATTSNLFGNILIFLPIGFFLPMASTHRNFFATSVYCFELSLIVELSQLLLKVGCFDVDDLFLNTLGGMLGYIAFTVCNVIRRKHEQKTK